MSSRRPFRFGLKLREAEDSAGWAEQVRRAEALGFDTILLPDHIDYGFAPLLAALAAAQATAQRIPARPSLKSEARAVFNANSRVEIPGTPVAAASCATPAIEY